MKNYYSCLAFGILAIVCHGSWMQPIMVMLLSTSLLHHGRKEQEYAEKRLIYWLDTLMAHTIALWSMYDAISMKIPLHVLQYIGLYWMCLSYVIMVFYVTRLSFSDGSHGERWHASTHVLSHTGMAA